MWRVRVGIRSEGRRAAMRALAAAPLLLDVPAGALRSLCTGTAEMLLCTHADAGTPSLRDHEAHKNASATPRRRTRATKHS